MTTSNPITVSGPELVITRVFDAPRELVFAAWIDYEQLAIWSGPTGFTIPSVEGDLRPGGEWRMCMSSEEHGTLWCHGVWREITPPERLVFTTAWENPDGAPEHEMLVTVTFADQGGTTEMTFHQAAFIHEQSRDSHNDGWSECFDKLAVLLAGESS
jgi:uncharacterized protein YndB with AHSA1/START domain